MIEKKKNSSLRTLLAFYKLTHDVFVGGDHGAERAVVGIVADDFPVRWANEGNRSRSWLVQTARLEFLWEMDTT